MIPKKVFLKKVLCTGIATCLMLSNAVVIASANAAENDGIKIYNSEISPYTMYYAYGDVTFSRGSSSLNVIVTTQAVTYVDNIYHTVTIYKNGTLYLSETYSDTDIDSLVTSIPVSVKSGDVVSVDVTHYTNHRRVTESGKSSDSIII